MEVSRTPFALYLIAVQGINRQMIDQGVEMHGNRLNGGVHTTIWATGNESRLSDASIGRVLFYTWHRPFFLAEPEEQRANAIKLALH